VKYIKKFSLLPGGHSNQAESFRIALAIYTAISSPTHPSFGWADRGNTCADLCCPWRSVAKVTLTFSTSAWAIDLEWKLVHIFILFANYQLRGLNTCAYSKGSTVTQYKSLFPLVLLINREKSLRVSLDRANGFKPKEARFRLDIR